MWAEFNKQKLQVTRCDDDFDMEKICQIAKQRCAGIVRAHILWDHPLSRIVEDCYLQGMRDTVDAVVKRGGKIVIPE